MNFDRLLTLHETLELLETYDACDFLGILEFIADGGSLLTSRRSEVIAWVMAQGYDPNQVRVE